MNRFIIVVAGVVLFAGFLAAESPDGAWTGEAGGWRLTVDQQGKIISMKDTRQREWAAPGGAPEGYRPVVLLQASGAPFAEAALAADPVVTAAANGVKFLFKGSGPDAFTFEYGIEFAALGKWPVLKRTLTLMPERTPFLARAEVRFPFNFAVAPEGLAVFVPRQDGRGETVALAESRYWEFPLGAFYRDAAPAAGEHLAIPMISVAPGPGDARVTTIADPYYSAAFTVSGPGDAGVVACHTGALPLVEPFTRTCWTVFQSGGPEAALDAWYAVALADVPAGPDWLHDVAWQHYDYLSHGGNGWFEDLDAVARHVAPEDRGKIVFALHGWYDLLGRYTFDAETNRLDDTWTAFPNAAAVKGKGFPTSEPVAFTKDELHRRIRYAKERGVRVVLYFADGLTACEGAGRFTPERLLAWGGWNGPDTIGKSYMQNPDNPEVYAWYIAYVKALLAEYGQELDGFVWDETFMIRDTACSPEGSPRRVYLAPVMMRLVRDITRTVTEYREDLAFLVSDCIGGSTDDVHFWTDVPPYAIMAHGCYQDSHSRPSVWPYGIFANYRNVLWSCNWMAVQHWGWTEFGVRNYDTPVATSNGWLDDKGVARLAEAEQDALWKLFAERKTRRQQLRWLDGPAPAYQERP